MNKTRKLLIAVCVVLLLAAAVTTGSVWAKYVQTKEFDDVPVSAKAFYFRSNYLTEEESEYKLNAGTDSIEIELYNFENALRISQVACTYTISVTSDDTSYSLSKTECTAAAGEQHTEKVKLENLKDGYSYTVTVRADGGYEKTLSATFNVMEAPNKVYMNVEETAEYVVLTLWTENVTGTAQIEFPKGLIPDATDPLLKTIDNYEGGVYQAGTFEDAVSFGSAYASRSYRFFKTTDYDNGDFTAKIGEHVAENASIS